jgi:hypothetical protein
MLDGYARPEGGVTDADTRLGVDGDAFRTDFRVG